jgi:sortase A
VNDRRARLVLLLALLLLLAGSTVVALEEAEQRPTALAVSPILQVAPTTTTTAPARSAVAPSAIDVAEPPRTTLPAPPPVTGGAVAPPRNSYAPEPIREIGRIRIPKIGLDHKVMEGITLRNIDQGPSHWPGTPMPGEVGNTVFMGHRTTHTRPFRPIDQLVPGDEIFFDIAGVQTRYVVTGHEIVTPDRLDIVDPTPTATATLFACHPPGSARYRYVVRAALAPVDDAAALDSSEATTPPTPTEG